MLLIDGKLFRKNPGLLYEALSYQQPTTINYNNSYLHLGRNYETTTCDCYDPDRL
jgi:hypothetical protein